MPITLDGQTVPMPKEFAPTVMKNAFEASVIGQLTNSEPLPLGDYVIPQYDGGFEVGVVGEAGRKPVGNVTVSHKVITPIKLAGIIVASKEAAKKDPVGMMKIVEQDMTNAISRGIDYGILYGKSANTGAAITNATCVNQTTNRVELAATDLVPQILAGYDLAAAGTADPNGFAFDSRWRTKVAMATQQIRTPAGVPQRSAGCSKGSAPPSRRAPAPLTGCGGIFCVQGPSGRLSEWLLTGLLNTRQPASMLV